MKSIKLNSLVTILLMLLFFGAGLSSCQIEKRIHRPGYHVQYKKSKPAKSAKIENSKEDNRAKSVEVQSFLEQENFAESLQEPLPKVENIENNITADSESKVIDNDIFKVDVKKDIFQECQTIVFTNGVEAKVTLEKITTSVIKYRRCDLEHGPLITVNKDDVYKIIYSNGEEDIITHEGAKRLNSNTESTGAKFEGYGLISFIAGIVGFFVAGIIFGPTAIIFGIISVALSSSDKREYKGKAFGVIGLLLGVLVTMIMILYFSSL